MNRLVVVMVAVLGAVAHAQDEDAGVPVEVPPVVDAGVPVAAAPVVPGAVVAPERPSAHERRRGSIGFGFLGTTSILRSVPTVGLDPTTGRPTSVSQYATVPMLGIRYWPVRYRIGMELGVGFMFSSAAAAMNGTPVGQTNDSTEFVGHLSLPIALGSTEHIIFFVAPEFRAGHSSAKSSGGSGTPDFAWSFDASLKGGVEIFFSFIGLDNLSVEAGVRVGVMHEFRSATVSSPLQPETFNTTSLTRFATSLVANPWELFTSTLAARYYF